MKKYDKKILITGIILVVFIAFTVAGLTYAFFVADVEGNPNATETVVETANLRLIFNDTEVITLDNSLPGASQTKTFTVQNVGNAKVQYDIDMKNVINTFLNDELVYSITSDNDGGEKEEDTLPTEEETLISNIIINPGVTQTYEIEVKFKETGSDQNSNQGATFSGKLEITPRINGVAMAGYVYDENDDPLPNVTIEMHSDPITTTTDEEGYYELINVPVGIHTIYIKNGEEVLGSKQVTIVAHDKTELKGNTLKLTELRDKDINIKVKTDLEIYLIESTGDLGILAMYVGGEYTKELDVNKYYRLTSYTCTNNEEINYNEITKTISITPTLKKTQCNLYFEDVTSFIYYKILADNTLKSDLNINFNSITGNGLYYTADEAYYGEDRERIYYFRGRVDNNWVSFAGYKWRIVRTTSEGGVKLVYSGNGSATSSGFITTAYLVSTSKYHVGYTYNTSSYTGTQSNSNSKREVDNWYNGGSGIKEYEEYLSPTAIYCNDKSIETLNGSNISYPANDRIMTRNRPTYACPSENSSRYTVSPETGNGYLQNPIALLTIDEINYAGVRKITAGLNSYIFDNATSNNWWTMTPNGFTSVASIFYVNKSGYFHNNISLGSQLGIRPSVSLKSCITVSEGNGSQETPYVLSNSACNN